MSTEFFKFLLAKLGLGKGACGSIKIIEDNFHRVLGYNTFETITTGNTLVVGYKGDSIALKYTFKDNVVTDLTIE